MTPTAEGLYVEELTWADYLALCAGSLASVELVPLDYLDRPAEPVTLTVGQNNGR